MKQYNILTPLTLTILLCSTHTFAFDLFNPDRGKAPPPAPIEPGALPIPFRALPTKAEAKKPKKLRPQKDFTLLGTSRLGNKRAVILKTPDNKEIVLRFRNKRTSIKNYEGYYLLSVKAREIRMEYPLDAPCQKSNEDKGIECNEADEGRTAIVSLPQRKAVAQQPAQPPLATARPPTTTPSSVPQRKPPKRPKNIRKIKDEDVPPGMRVVHTPFGDRLVPIE